MSSVISAPPKISPVTVKLPPTLKLLGIVIEPPGPTVSALLITTEPVPFPFKFKSPLVMLDATVLLEKYMSPTSKNLKLPFNQRLPVPPNM